MGRHETRHMGDGGEIVIPKNMRERLGIGPGDEVTFEEREDGAVVILPLHGESERSGSSGRGRTARVRSSSSRSTRGPRHAERTDDCF